jgi:hypothetical protein
MRRKKRQEKDVGGSKGAGGRHVGGNISKQLERRAFI